MTPTDAGNSRGSGMGSELGEAQARYDALIAKHAPIRAANKKRIEALQKAQNFAWMMVLLSLTTPVVLIVAAVLMGKD